MNKLQMEPEHDELTEDLRSFKEIFDELLDHIMIIDGHSGKVTEINKIWMSTTGFSRDEILGKHFSEVFCDEQISNLEELEAIVTHDSVVANRLLRKKDGTSIPVEMSLSMVNFKGQNSILTVLRNITERLESEQKIREMNKMLGELNTTKDKLFSVIAHDLRNQFNVLISFSDILLKDINTMPETERFYFLSQIESVSRTTYGLLSNLLHWARSQTGILVIKKEILIVNNLISSVCEELNGSIITKELLIKFDKSQTVIVYSDEDILRTVLRNLLSNAIKFSNRNGKIEINLSEFETELEIEIKDFGTGMDEEQQKMIFQVGGVSKKGTAKEEGTGLGLTICKEFINKLGGRIWFKSAPGEGTSMFFTVELPH
ncbi:MAG: PAS domain S-box protein [Ignavibacteriales bacterium]|jgi:two-component system sensor histidine kinase/response regulator|nr:PAS domain S-box protein [Ignavibacteriales bacterium]MBP7542021.1 PAS domain S-box protein [Ignavibacteriaceae bacterium]MBP9121632.1 PAS domain S-box protein [Ignavibacteriaceae bacterium]